MVMRRIWAFIESIVFSLLVVLAVAGLMWLGLMWLASRANAEDIDGRWTRQTIRQQYRHCDDWGRCRYRWREVNRPAIRYYAAPREDDRWERDETERCLDRKRVVGTEHATIDGALTAAKRQWMSLVRWDHGEKFMNIDISKNYMQRCERSSTNETAAGRVAEGLTGSFYTRCEVVAEPCVARRVRTEEERRP